MGGSKMSGTCWWLMSYVLVQFKVCKSMSYLKAGLPWHWPGLWPSHLLFTPLQCSATSCLQLHAPACSLLSRLLLQVRTVFLSLTSFLQSSSLMVFFKEGDSEKSQGEILLRRLALAGELAQWLRTLVALQRTGLDSQHPNGHSQSSVIPTPQDLTPSVDL